MIGGGGPIDPFNPSLADWQANHAIYRLVESFLLRPSYTR
jgi:hypothetical protein